MPVVLLESHHDSSIEVMDSKSCISAFSVPTIQVDRHGSKAGQHRKHVRVWLLDKRFPVERMSQRRMCRRMPQWRSFKGALFRYLMLTLFIFFAGGGDKQIGKPNEKKNYFENVLEKRSRFPARLLVGKLLTRSTNSSFFSWPQLSIFCQIFRYS